MTDEDLTGAAEARERARRLLAKAAERRAGAPPPAPEPSPGLTLRQQLDLETDRPSELGPRRDRLQSTTAVHGLHELLRDLAAYLGDRPQRDADAMALYRRVMAMLGEQS